MQMPNQARQRRFELPTLRSVAVCSIQLSYWRTLERFRITVTHSTKSILLHIFIYVNTFWNFYSTFSKTVFQGNIPAAWEEVPWNVKNSQKFVRNLSAPCRTPYIPLTIRKFCPCNLLPGCSVLSIYDIPLIQYFQTVRNPRSKHAGSRTAIFVF